MNNTRSSKQQRKIRVSSHVRGTSERPRLSVFRSNEYIYAQVIDDTLGKTLVGLSEKSLGKVAGNKTERAKTLGMQLAKAAVEKKIKQVVFDKGAYRYHGRVRAVAEGAREGGLQF